MAIYCPIRRNFTVYAACNECEEKECKSFFCLVVGSRSFNNYELMKTKLDHILRYQQKVTIVSGGAKGADALAEKYAKEHGYTFMEFKADWSMGKIAGFARNEKMHEFISHFTKRGVVAFWDGESRGTESNFNLAKKYGNEIRIIKYKETESDERSN